MKIQKWHLFVFVTLLFGFSFYVINLKFDKFYRVNGINNDNRVLIEKYLTKDEQTFLIENQINIDLFIDYIEYDEFYLENYQYYNLLENTGRYKKKLDILTTGNEISSRLNDLFDNKAYMNAYKLIGFSLEKAFLSVEEFDFDYINLYAYMLTLYSESDYSFIDDTHKYIDILKEMGVFDIDELSEIFFSLSQSYSKDNLKRFLTAELDEGILKVLNSKLPYVIVDQSHYVGRYEPSELLLIQDVDRLRYSMYLQNDAYNALLNLYNDLSNETDGFLLREAYKNYETLDSDKIGYDEFQLGLSINVSKQGVSYSQFENTDVSQWLEEHAYEYGYVLRYPKNKASITGYEYDSHIYRYVGEKLAKYLYDSSLSLDEYYKSQE